MHCLLLSNQGFNSREASSSWCYEQGNHCHSGPIVKEQNQGLICFEQDLLGGYCQVSSDEQLKCEVFVWFLGIL